MTDEYGLNPRVSGVSLLDLRTLFGNDNPVILEIGSGKGRFLFEAARDNPLCNYLGVEKSLHYSRFIERRLRASTVTNARVINFDAETVLAEMLPSSSVREIHIYFPDPWPKKKRQKRRIVRPGTLHEFSRVLEAGGAGIYVTDHQTYFEAAALAFEQVFDIDAGEVPDSRAPRTNYEAKFREEGRPIFELRFRKR